MPDSMFAINIISPFRMNQVNATDQDCHLLFLYKLKNISLREINEKSQSSRKFIFLALKMLNFVLLMQRCQCTLLANYN